MPYIIPNNLLKPTEKVIKPYNCSMIAVDGPTIKGKLNMEGIEIPYESQYTSQLILNENSKNQPILYGFLGKSVTFLMIKAIYEPQDPNWEIEEDHYIEYYFEDDPNTIRTMGKLLLLTGNSLKRIPQIYLNNPNSKQKVYLEVFMANQHQDDINLNNYININIIKNLYYNNIISDKIDYTNPISVGSSSLFITDINDNVILTIPYKNINTIERNGNMLILGNNTEEKIYLEFLSEFNMKQTHSRISWVLESISNRYLTKTSPQIDNVPPIIIWNDGISTTGYTIITTGDVDYIINTFISGITDNIDGEIDKYDIELTIYHEENVVPVNLIEEPGLYDIYFKISDIAGNENNSLRKAIVFRKFLSSSLSDLQNICSMSVEFYFYHNGPNDLPVVNDKVYLDNLGTNPINDGIYVYKISNDKYPYEIENGIVKQIFEKC